MLGMFIKCVVWMFLGRTSSYPYDWAPRAGGRIDVLPEIPLVAEPGGRGASHYNARKRYQTLAATILSQTLIHLTVLEHLAVHMQYSHHGKQ